MLIIKTKTNPNDQPMKNQNLKSISLGLLAVGALLLTSCSSVPKQADSGPIKARSFSFINGGVPAAASFADNREQFHALVQQKLTAGLAAKGLTKVTTGGDVTVAYLIIVGNNASTEMINTYFGYGRDASGLHEKAQDAYTGNKNPNYFEAGTLLLDLVDSRSNKLLRRTYATRPVLKDPTVAARAENVQEAVDAVLAGLTIAR